MTVNINELRKSIVKKYNDLVDLLNDEIERTGGMNTIEIDVEEIGAHLDDLRADIAILMCIYDEESGVESLAGMPLKQVWTNFQD